MTNSRSEKSAKLAGNETNHPGLKRAREAVLRAGKFAVGLAALALAADVGLDMLDGNGENEIVSGHPN